MKTAVEWLVEQIKNNVHNTIEEFELIVEQAKEKEKQQILNSVVWFDDTDRRPCEIEKDAEQYYNETFKSE